MSDSKSKLKQIGAVVAVVASLGILGFVVARHTVLAPVSAANASRLWPAVDAETGEAFPDFKVGDGEMYPWVNPKTGKKTVYPAESCYWTKDGKAKLEPTLVILNSLLGKKNQPTICPDCGRTVTAHNPMPPTQLLVEAAKKKGP